MSGIEIAQQFVNALALGGTYALLALGLAIVFNILLFVNFAHGEQLTVGAFAVYVAQLLGAPWLVAALIGLLAAVLSGILMELLAFRPVRGADPNTLLLTSFAMSLLIQAALVMTISPRPQPVPVPRFLTRVVYVGPLHLGVLDLSTTVVAFVTLVGLIFFFRRTSLGISIRAAAEDFETARLMGIRANRVVLTAFAMSGALAGVAALVWIAKIGTVDPVMGLIPMLKAFVAAVLGGLRSLSGPVAGGFLLGAMEVTFQAILPTELLPYGDAFAFTAVVLVLLVRPHGLFVRSKT